MIARTLIVLAALASVPLAAQTKNVQDYLPLAVGNSWTYEHDFSDARSILDDPSIESTEEALIESREEITISILRTEVIDEDTYYVFSDVSTSVSEGVPRHFLNGKKLRWDGNHLTEHDGTSSISLYRFDVPTDANRRITGEYSIRETHGDTHVEARANMRSSNRVLYQVFKFDGHVPDSGLRFSRSIAFAEGFGVQRSVEVWGSGDMILASNRLRPVRAVFHTTESSQTGTARDASTPTTVAWNDFNCYFSGRDVKYGATCNYPPTSTSASSWGSIKDWSNNQ